MLLNVPFFSQSWDLENWQSAGFASREEMAYWQVSSCGVLCLRMIIAFYHKKTIPIYELITKGTEFNIYTHQNGWSHPGLSHLANWYGLRGEVGNFSLKQISHAISNHQIPIVSIKWGFKTTKTLKERILFWKKYGGHLALIVGYEGPTYRPDGLYVHHTSTKPEYNWSTKFINRSVFERSYTGRGILIHR